MTFTASSLFPAPCGLWPPQVANKGAVDAALRDAETRAREAELEAGSLRSREGATSQALQALQATHQDTVRALAERTSALEVAQAASAANVDAGAKLAALTTERDAAAGALKAATVELETLRPQVGVGWGWVAGRARSLCTTCAVCLVPSAHSRTHSSPHQVHTPVPPCEGTGLRRWWSHLSPCGIPVARWAHVVCVRAAEGGSGPRASAAAGQHCSRDPTRPAAV